jgi:hypothetical protein
MREKEQTERSGMEGESTAQRNGEVRGTTAATTRSEVQRRCWSALTQLKDIQRGMYAWTLCNTLTPHTPVPSNTHTKGDSPPSFPSFIVHVHLLFPGSVQLMVALNEVNLTPLHHPHIQPLISIQAGMELL